MYYFPLTTPTGAVKGTNLLIISITANTDSGLPALVYLISPCPLFVIDLLKRRLTSRLLWFLLQCHKLHPISDCLGIPYKAQQFGIEMLSRHLFLLFPSSIPKACFQLHFQLNTLIFITKYLQYLHQVTDDGKLLIRRVDWYHIRMSLNLNLYCILTPKLIYWNSI